MTVQIISFAFQIYEFLLVFRIILTWLPHDYNHPLVRGLGKVTDPYLEMFRSLPLQFGGFDFSPIVAFFVLDFIRQLVLRLFVF
ncbi:MAG: YggT family protein [Candidatus Margulisbacteria bacterium]|nr:YggT family protein [Candidatus Margulisiibacteriota bacterium]